MSEENKFETNFASMQTYHFADCTNCDYIGPNRSTPNQAADDAIEHKNEDGNRLHVVVVETVQKFRVQIDD